MRKVIECCLVSADGIVLDDPFPFGEYLDETYLRDRLGLFAACEAMLWGRTTYERFASRWTAGDMVRPYAARLNAIPKYVFSSKLETAGWGNATLVRGDVATEVSRLKHQDGGDLLVLGHGLLGETLLKEGLLDVLELAIYPVVAGHGKPRSKNSRYDGVGRKAFGNPACLGTRFLRPVSLFRADLVPARG